MTNKELKALRQILTLECSEAAEHIAGVSTRSWQRWEAGVVPVPDDVANQLTDLANIRDGLVEQHYEEFQAAGDVITLNFYMTIDEFAAATGKHNVPMWRVTNSVAGECLSSGIARIV
ncbi:hypothetical protein B9T65_25200 [Serratia marcescens]|uniref:Aca2/YdiL-like domain-containing protein n=1 Tax=Serratia marcescens TaxID=615 RepID=UPI000BFEE2AD|nr:DUF1870 family protein [Serratia marcescens]PHI44607.1 hypothetical protein B9T65_25200 [Serratia marcescens]